MPTPFLALGLALAAAAPVDPDDPRAAALAAHAVPLRSIDLADDDFSDLDRVGEAIGDARVVLLGEPSHGDGATFLAKSRLVRYLHQEKGFTVLAWESGLFDCHVMQEKLADPSLRTDASASWGVFAIWSASAQVIPLFRYARTTLDSPRPLTMAGMDAQFSARGSEGWLPFFLEWIDAADASLLPAELRTGLGTAHRRLHQSPFFPARSQLERDREVVDAIDALLARPDGPLVERYGAEEVAFVRRTLRNFLVQSELRLLFQRPDTRAAGNRLRAETMADNLLWLANERHRGEKIVVWAGTHHLARALDSVTLDVEGVSFERTRSVGDLVHEALGDDVYAILFTAYDGEGGMLRQPPFAVEPAPEGSLEEICHRTGAELLFVDLRHAPTDGGAAFLDGRFSARPLAYRPGEARWRDVCDAFVFTRTMTPVTLPPDDDFGE